MKPVNLDGCFGWLHLPKAKPKSVGFVLCPGLKTDDLNGYGSLKTLADTLCGHGFSVLRLHYVQTGDSADTTASDYWPTWQNNVEHAIDWLRETCNLQEVALCGLRFGAMLACAVASRRNDVTGLVMLAPVLRGRTYMRQLQFDGYFKVGASLSASDTASLNALDLKSIPPLGQCDSIMFVQSAGSAAVTDFTEAWQAAGKSIKVHDFTDMNAFIRPTFANDSPSADISPILAWANRLYAKRPSCNLPEIDLPPVTISGSQWVEKPFWFGNSQFGILCRPREATQGDGSIVLIGNSSADSHSAINIVALARHLAAQGMASLRMDFVGVGDSIVNNQTTHVFEVDRMTDFSAAVDALQPLGYDKFATTGLCSGAYHAYHAAIHDARIEFALMINLPFFEWMKGFPVENLVFHIRTTKQLLDEAKTYAFWRTQWNKITAGDISIIKNRFAGLMRRLGKAPGGVINPGRMAAHPVKMLFMTSQGDISNVAFKRRYGKGTADCMVDMIEGLDHSMHRREMANVVAHRMVSFMDQASASVASKSVIHAATADAPLLMERVN